jgi:4-hydroxy-tetrahydrodipicolinate synthase
VRFEGVYTVLPTPFTPSGDVDLDSLRRVVDVIVAAGVDGVTALGVTSETVKLTDAERAAVLEASVRAVDGRVTVIAGATAEGTRATIEYARAARSLGASAAMINLPRLAKLNSDGVLRHFAAVAEALDFPIVVQDFPPLCGYTVEPWLLARIAREVPPARTIKLEDAPSPQKIARIREHTQGAEVSVLGGLGGVYLFEELLAGSSGVMTGFAYPEALVEVVRHFRAGRLDEAADAFYRFAPLIRFEFQEGVGMAIRKEILRRRGAIAHATVRAPGGTLDAATLEGLDRVLRWTKARGGTWISVHADLHMQS